MADIEDFERRLVENRMQEQGLEAGKDYKFITTEDNSMARVALEAEIAAVLNKHSAENASNTPDFILAQYLWACLLAFDVAVQMRETWYGRDTESETYQPPTPRSSP